MSAAQIKSQALPLYKILLHAAKFPHNNICGLLLGHATDDEVTVSDAIPLFHVTAALAAPVEIALSQVEAYVDKSEGKLKIVGFYESDARMKADDLSIIGRRIADRISEKYPWSAVLVLNNSKLQSFVESSSEEPSSCPHPFEPYTKQHGAFKGAGQEALIMAGGKSGWTHLLEDFRKAFSTQQHHKIVDFDEHLDDVSKDYLNPNVRPSSAVVH